MSAGTWMPGTSHAGSRRRRLGERLAWRRAGRDVRRPVPASPVVQGQARPDLYSSLGRGWPYSSGDVQDEGPGRKPASGTAHLCAQRRPVRCCHRPSVPEARQARVQAARAGELSWYQHALNYLTRRRKGPAGNSVRSVAETLATVTPVLLVPGEGRPDDGQLREVLYRWAFRDKHDPPEDVAAILRWVADHSRPLADLADPDLMLEVLDAIASKLDGTAAAANTVTRKRPCSAMCWTTVSASALTPTRCGKPRRCGPRLVRLRVRWTRVSWLTAARLRSC